MASNQGQLGGRFSLRVGSDRISALEQLAFDRSTAHDKVTRAELIREAIDEYLRDNWEDLPEEAKDFLDEDMIANAGGEEAAEA